MKPATSAKSEGGFGIVELLIAMTILAVALMALVAAFSSAYFAVRRASNVIAATNLADSAMETYRTMLYDDVGLDISAGTLGALDTTYKNDTVCFDSASGTNCTQSGSPAGKKLTGPTNDTCTSINGWYPGTTLPCVPSQVVTGGDGHRYRVDQYVATTTSVTGGQRAHKNVAVVVRDAATNQVLVREQDVFDCSTGGGSFNKSSYC